MTAIGSSDQIELSGALDAAKIRALLSRGPIKYVSFSQGPKLTRRISKLFDASASIQQIWLWLDVTRNALNDVISISDLKVLDVLGLSAPGQLGGFKDAAALEVFRCGDALTRADLIEVLRAPKLHELRSHHTIIDGQVVDAMLGCKTLMKLDLEYSNINDTMIEALSRSEALVSLAIGATRMTGTGLKSVCKMTQLEHLDIWFTKIEDADLTCLSELPNLKRLSAGGHSHGPLALHAELILPALRRLTSLEELWLDGVYCNAGEEREIRALFPKVKIDRVVDR